MTKYIYIKADTNDADYISEMKQITDEELEIIKPVIQAIKEYDKDKSIKKQKYNWWDIESSRHPAPEKLYIESGKVTQEQLDAFREYIPYGEHGVHTIEEITLYNVESEEELL
jgi:hypothetical protein